MRHRSRRATVLVAVVLLQALGTGASAQGSEQQLFNKVNLDGWQHVGPGSFTVRDQVLRTQGGMGLLWYARAPIVNSVIRVVYMTRSLQADSGVFIRIPAKPREPWMPINKGYEIEIGEWPSEYARTGVIYSFTKSKLPSSPPLGQWHTLEITIDGPHTTVLLNGQTVTDYREGDPTPPRTGEMGEPKAGIRLDGGYIGLQNEPGPPVYFSEISVRPLVKPVN